MINTSHFVKATWGQFIGIGTKDKESLTLLHNSLYNFGGLSSTSLLSLGSDFYYLLVSREGYIKSRAANMVRNWPYSYKGKSGKLPNRLSKIAAERELDSIKSEQFLNSINSADGNFYDISKNDDFDLAAENSHAHSLSKSLPNKE